MPSSAPVRSFPGICRTTHWRSASPPGASGGWASMARSLTCHLLAQRRLRRGVRRPERDIDWSVHTSPALIEEDMQFIDLAAQYAVLKPAIDARIAGVLDRKSTRLNSSH